MMVFIKSEETQNINHQEKEIIKNNTFTSTIMTKTHNFIPDDF